ncbi:hypothetical protein [Halocatena pleomorpha]|uniref:Uncharacterized protein n=1 Tax=Halocatena pleomorpha TaxID=1785090 RepID=A0A3P3R647_9EURY|nr:hypothetical protein [Halocatena pleomorpha]RRJ28100.1 hypothetical protein EIK79_16620 [Halocatena pleomorpha]
MQRDTKDDINRRKVLKMVGASSLAVAGMPATTSAQEANISNGDINEILKTPPVQAILDELNHPELGTATQRTQNIGDKVINVTNISVSYGKLTYAETSGKAEAKFTFDPGAKDSPSKYQQLPEGSNPALLSDGKTTTFNRAATTSELNAIKKVTDVSDDAMVATGSNVNDFLIMEAVDGSMQERILTIDAEFNSLTDEVGTDVHLNKDNVTIEPRINASASCQTWAFRCLAAGGACGACSSTCASAPTGIGLIACISCIQAVCTAGEVACAAAIGKCL